MSGFCGPLRRWALRRPLPYRRRPFPVSYTHLGEIEQATLEEDLPYDVNADVIEIKPEAYGIWYIDCMDQPERYKGCLLYTSGGALPGNFGAAGFFES